MGTNLGRPRRRVRSITRVDAHGTVKMPDRVRALLTLLGWDERKPVEIRMAAGKVIITQRGNPDQ